jgi:hypothetical protein
MPNTIYYPVEGNRHGGGERRLAANLLHYGSEKAPHSAEPGTASADDYRSLCVRQYTAPLRKPRPVRDTAARAAVLVLFTVDWWAEAISRSAFRLSLSSVGGSFGQHVASTIER